MEQNETKSCQKVAPKYFCESCHYNTTKKSSFDKHLLTRKHLDETKMKQNILLICECNKVFNSRTTLWRHKKKCAIEKCEKIENGEINNVYDSLNITPEIILNVIQQNQEFKELLIEQNKQNHELQKQNNELQKQMLEAFKNGTNNNNIITNNSHNKTFNLQFFLNETCKNAMNIMDFVDSIKIQLIRLC